MLEILLSSLEIGLIFAIASLGIYLTFNILNFPDLTADASFVTGAAVTAALVQNDFPIYLTMATSILAGMLAGTLTALIHIKFGVQKILAGIIALAMLYTINLRIMMSPNISLLNSENILSFFKIDSSVYIKILGLLFFVLLVKYFIDRFLQTEVGLQLRAVGDNEHTAKNFRINVDRSKMILLAISNGLVALAGCLFAQDTGFADINMGMGIIILGLAGIMIGSIFIRNRKISTITICIILGSIVYQLIVNVALRLGLQPTDLKFIMGIIILLTLYFGNKKLYAN